MIERWLEPHIVESMKYRRVVHLTGARQTGKTTLVSSIPFPKTRRYTMDNARIRETAWSDPIEFTRRNEGEVMLLDEVQKVPELLNAVKIHVDESNERGQYLLTGSASLDFSKAVSDSLAGRMHSVRLRSLALGEINGNKPLFLHNAFCREFKAPGSSLNKKDIIRLAFCGGYPEAMELPPRPRKQWYQDYLKTLINRDIKAVTEIRKSDILREIAKWLLSRTSKLFAIEDLCTAAGVSKPTTDNYINAMCALYMFDKVPAWNDEGTMANEEKVLITQSIKEVGECMSNYVGIVRSDLRLKRAWDRLDLLYEETENLFKRVKVSKDLCELRNMINVGYLITRMAIERKESRGLHYTIDYPVHAYDKK